MIRFQLISNVMGLTRWAWKCPICLVRNESSDVMTTEESCKHPLTPSEVLCGGCGTRHIAEAESPRPVMAWPGLGDYK